MDLLHQTESAINTFYHCHTQYERSAAHQWLLQLQKSSEGWQISWMLLDVSKPIEVQYYGANILHYKIANNINDMEQEQMGDLKNKFQQLLCTYSTGPKLVISKLCSVYAAFTVQIIDEDSELLQCINDVENAFKITGIDSKDVILELLTVIPSEFKTLNLPSKQKIIARKFMNDFIPMLLGMCNHVLRNDNCNPNDLKYQNDTLNCFLSWVEFGVSVADAKDLLPLLFSKVENDDLSNKVCEVLIELITSPTSYSVENSVLNFMEHVLKLNHLVDLSISQENHELLNNLCLLYCNLGETHCRTFLKTTEGSSQVSMFNFVNVILKLTSTKGFYPVDETCSELTLNFWYTLQDDLYSLDELTDYHKQFQKAYIMLVDVLRLKCQYPPDQVYEKYSVEDKELFRCYRIDIQDTMLYIYTLLQEKCLEYFCHKLESLFADPSSSWQSFEAILHLLRGATESIDSDESIYLSRLLTMLKSLPRHPRILDSLFFFLGGLSEWFNSHPNEIVSMLPFLLQGILNPDTATSCSIALKDICHECALLLSTEAVLEILQTCNKGIHSQTSSLKVVVRLFEIGGFVVSVLQVEQMNAQIHLLITPLFQWFKAILQTPSVTTLSKKKIVHYLNCFNGLFRALDPFQELQTHPIVLVFRQLIPLFRVLKLWCGFEEVAIAATNCITKALEVAREKLIDNVHIMSEVLAEFFLTQPFGCVLDASSTLIGMFGAETDCTERIRNLYSLLTTTCVKMVESDEGKNHPDCMQAFMDLSIRVVKTVPEFLYGSADEQLVLLKSVLILMTYQETPTIKSTCNFVVTYLNFSGAFESSRQVIESVGRDLVVQCLLCISGISPRHTTDHFAEIMLAFSKHYVTFLATWFAELFSTDGFPSMNATAVQKEYFQSAILREKTNKRKMKELISFHFVPSNQVRLKMLFRFLLLCLCIANSRCDSKEVVLESLLKDYDNKVLPQADVRGPVNIMVKLNVIGIKSSTSKKLFNHYTIDFIIQQKWHDFRLKHNESEPITLSGDVVESLWRPDTRALTEKKSFPSKLIKSTKLAKLHPDGTVISSQRCSLVNYCKMDFTTFPFDSQLCELVLESYSYSNSYLSLSWMEKNISDSFRITDDPKMEEFVFQSFKVDKIEFHYSGEGSGTHDQLTVKMKFYRPVGFYLVRLYLPITLIVMLSWLSFWVDHRSVPARTGMGITTVLIFVIVRMNIFQRDVPAGRELNWYDIYSQICFSFVFMALVEYSMAQSIDIKYRLSDWYRVRQGNPDNDLLDYEDTVENTVNQVEDQKDGNKFDTLLSKLSLEYIDYIHSRNREQFHILDKVSRIAFPLLFIIVSVIYFCIVFQHYTKARARLGDYTDVHWDEGSNVSNYTVVFDN